MTAPSEDYVLPRTAAFAPDYARYDEPAFCGEFLADMARTSPLQQRFPQGHTVLRYDPEHYDFRGLVADALAAAGMVDRETVRAHGGRLELLHEWIAPQHQAMDVSQQSAAARALYEMPVVFADLYRRFLAEAVLPQLCLGDAYYQTTPTFRVFFPHAQGYPGATTYHNDIMLGHNPREVNVFVPLVRCEGTRSLLFAGLDESLALLRDYGADFARFGRDTQQDERVKGELAAICRPLEVDVGDVVVFDARCLHAGPANTTPLTRVTFDVRLLPEADFATQQNRYQGRGRRRATFAPGTYFSADPVGV